MILEGRRSARAARRLSDAASGEGGEPRGDRRLRPRGRARAWRPPPARPRVDLDWSSYAGKRRQLPWFILSALVLARNGWRVFMHGAEAHTEGRIYTGTALRALGMPVATNLDEAAQQLTQRQLRLSADRRALSPPIADMLDLRPILGLRSPVHTFARMLNPFAAPAHAAGRFPSRLHAHSTATPALILGQPRLAVFRGEGGEIERRPSKPCDVMMAIDGAALDERWPPMIDEPRQAPDEIDGPLPPRAPVWRGDIEDEYGEAAVVGTLAIALRTLGDADDAWRRRGAGASAVGRARRGAASRRRPDRWPGSSSPLRTSRRARRRSRSVSPRRCAADGLDRPDLQEGAGLHRPDVARARERPRVLQPRLQHADAGRNPCDLRAQRAAAPTSRSSRATRACTTASTWRAANSSAALAKLLPRRSSLSSTPAAWRAASRRWCRAMRRSTAKARIAGVILNKVGSERQTAKLVSALERYTDIPVLGAIGRDEGIARSRAPPRPDDARTRLRAPTRSSPPLATPSGAASTSTGFGGSRTSAPRLTLPVARSQRRGEPRMSTVAVARDEAFGFYYADDLEAFARAGREARLFRRPAGPALAACDALFIGGGFPETHAARLAANVSLSATSARRSRAVCRPTPNAAA